ncbi:MAG: ribosomal L7Ae/L30e/S12e/Gadd45 family protein [Firmicutes bacterium]|nr:ribosomal L7Ae/L30e/S12e/Gadd45 family protein [Bacillota bacterium]
MNGSWLAMLGLARRAGRLLAGTETVLAGIRRGRVSLLVLAADLSPATRERLARAAAASGVRMLVAGRLEELARATGCRGRGVYGVTGHDFAVKIESSLARDGAGTAEGGGKDSEQDSSP